MLTAEVADLIAGRRLASDIPANAVRQAIGGGIGALLHATALDQGSTTAWSKRLGMRYLRSVEQSQAVARDVEKIQQHANAHGLTLALYKGLAASEMLYEQLGQRRSSDIDLYVGHWESPSRVKFFEALGVPAERTKAIENLADRGRPLHEATLRAVTGTERANIDAHFNIYGLLPPCRNGDIAHAWQLAQLSSGGQVQFPRPELALAVALVNLTRKGGGVLWHAVDAVRLIQGRAGALDWDYYDQLLAADGLRSISAQTLWAIADAIQLDLELPTKRPRRRAWWAPQLGEDTPSLLRRGTLVPLHRPPAFFGESVIALGRWYLPSKELCVASDRPGLAAAVKSVVRRTP